MRLRNIPEARDVIAECDYCVKNPKDNQGKWREVFENKNAPLYLEIGMGKGRFILEQARKHPDINFIGIEYYSSVLYKAILKLNREEVLPKNLLFICGNANELADEFAEGEVDKIYLNFSDPWPKDRHAKRRLTSKNFLGLYDKVLKKEGDLEFKTDNKDLFDFSVEEAPKAGWKIVECTYDLHHDERLFEGNVMTEYEARFSSKGNPICKMIICR